MQFIHTHGRTNTQNIYVCIHTHYAHTRWSHKKTPTYPAVSIIRLCCKEENRQQSLILHTALCAFTQSSPVEKRREIREYIQELKSTFILFMGTGTLPLSARLMSMGGEEKDWRESQRRRPRVKRKMEGRGLRDRGCCAKVQRKWGEVDTGRE